MLSKIALRTNPWAKPKNQYLTITPSVFFQPFWSLTYLTLQNTRSVLPINIIFCLFSFDLYILKVIKVLLSLSFHKKVLIRFLVFKYKSIFKNLLGNTNKKLLFEKSYNFTFFLLCKSPKGQVSDKSLHYFHFSYQPRLSVFF